MKINKLVLYIFGIFASIFTIINIIFNIIIPISNGQYIVWWYIFFMWPIELLQFFKFVFLNPSTFFLSVPILVYFKSIVALVSPFLAFAVARKFGHSRTLWFILTLIFPFILILIAVHPPKTRITIAEKKNIIKSTIKIFLLPLIIFIVSLWPSNGGTVYLVVAPWINSDNVFGDIFAGFTILIGFILIPVGVLVALGIIKTEAF